MRSRQVPSAASTRELLNACRKSTAKPEQRPNYGKYWMYHVRRMLQANHGCCETAAKHCLSPSYGPVHQWQRQIEVALCSCRPGSTGGVSSSPGASGPLTRRNTPAPHPLLVRPSQCASCHLPFRAAPARDHRNPPLALVGPHLLPDSRSRGGRKRRGAASPQPAGPSPARQ